MKINFVSLTIRAIFIQNFRWNRGAAVVARVKWRRSEEIGVVRVCFGIILDVFVIEDRMRLQSQLHRTVFYSMVRNVDILHYISSA